MKIRDKVAVVTGAASGIGKAAAERFHAEGAKHVVLVDLNGDGAKEAASAIGGTGIGLDVSDEGAIQQLVTDTVAQHGPVDIFFSNAGYVTVGGVEESNQQLQRMWEVHVLAHIYAARAVLPSMIERGEGYILSTASAAGLLSQIGSVSYSITKHAAVALAEWLYITHGHQGVRVSVLCPQAVATNIGKNSPQKRPPGSSPGVASGDGVLSSEAVAQNILDAMEAERFWILPHPEVAEYVRRKASDVDRWLHGMQRFQQKLYEGQSLPAEWLGEPESSTPEV